MSERAIFHSSKSETTFDNATIAFNPARRGSGGIIYLYGEQCEIMLYG
jgi:hypothetical protein